MADANTEKKQEEISEVNDNSNRPSSNNESLNNEGEGEERRDRTGVMGASSLFTYFFKFVTNEQAPLRSVVMGLSCLLCAGIFLGAVMPKNHSLPTLYYRYISSILGYTYFTAWAISFYPQVFLNYIRKSTVGYSTDFAVLNLIGFACYSIYTASFYWNPSIREQYRQRHENADNTVQSNDVAFAIHAFLLCAITNFQIWSYGGKTLSAFRLSRPVYIGLFITVWISILAAMFITFAPSSINHRWQWIDFLYLLSLIKIIISIAKYIPQAILNARRRSTIGWNIWNIILDFTGGLLSLLQLVLDSADLGDWSGITGNFAKLFLALISMSFDVLFLTQHYVLYPPNEQDLLEDLIPLQADAGSYNTDALSTL